MLQFHTKFILHKAHSCRKLNLLAKIKCTDMLQLWHDREFLMAMRKCWNTQLPAKGVLICG